MFGLGVPELIFIFVLALLIFGPKRLPELGRTVGRGMSEFRKASNELQRTINTELALDDPVPPPPARPSRLDALVTPRSPSPAATAPIPPDDLDDEDPDPEIEPAVSNRPVEPR